MRFATDKALSTIVLLPHSVVSRSESTVAALGHSVVSQCVYGSRISFIFTKKRRHYSTLSSPKKLNSLREPLRVRARMSLSWPSQVTLCL
jgi:hypothetical protein